MENEQRIIKLLAENIDEKIKLKGMSEILDGVVIQSWLMAGFKALNNKHPEIAAEFIQLVEAYLTADKSGMVDEAADILAEIVKKIYKVG